MDFESTKSRLQLLPQLTAVAAAVLYVVGFLTLSLHHGSFGISQYSLLRPKILAAGILFAVFMGLPVLEAARAFEFWGFGKAAKATPASTIDSHRLRLLQLLSFLTASVGISAVMRPFLKDFHFAKASLWLLASVVAALLASVFGKTIGKRRPTLSVLVSILAIGLFIGAVSSSMRDDSTLTFLVLWFMWSGMIARHVNSVIENPKKLRTINWHLWITNSVATVTFFALLLYPRIDASYGGGAPIPLAIGLVDKNVLQTNSARVWLIDETDLGYYVVRSKDSKKAIFIPRSLVTSAVFGEDKPDAEKQANDPAK